jgi:hypothetical protein
MRVESPLDPFPGASVVIVSKSFLRLDLGRDFVIVSVGIRFIMITVTWRR